MANVIFKQGLSTNLPASGASNELFFCTDTLQLFKGTDAGIALYSDVVVVETLSVSGIQGKVYVQTSDNTIHRWNGTAWVQLSSSASTFTANSTDTLQNKTISASNNTISDLSTSNFGANVIDTDGTLTANSDSRIASQKSIKTYVDNKFSSVVTGATLGGDLNASLGVFPSNSIKGNYYYITNNGTIDGLVMNTGDLIIARIDNASTTLSSDWILVDSTEASNIIRTTDISTDPNFTLDLTKLTDRGTLKTFVESQLSWKTF